MHTSSSPRTSTLARLSLALAALAGVILGGVLSSAPATAAVIADGITSVTPNKTSYDYTERVGLAFTWAVPDSAAAGDTFTLTLPPALTAASLTPFTLTAPDGTAVAEAEWSGTTATFTLTDYVSTHDGVSGSGHLSAEWDRDVIPEQGGPVVLDFGATATTVVVGPKPDCETDCGPTRTERGAWKGSDWADGNYEGTRDPSGNIRWIVELPGGPTGLTGPVTVVDTVGAGSTVDCDSFIVLARPNLAHGTAPAPVDPSRYSLSCTDSGFTAVVDSVSPEEFIDFQYTGTITDQTSGSYSNAVEITIPGSSWEASATQRRIEAGGDGNGSTSVSVGDLVWLDTDGDGQQAPHEPGIPGVVLSLSGPNGGPVTDIDGRVVTPVTTDANGNYRFDRLPVIPAGQHYTVTVDAAASADALAGLTPTVPHVGDPATDSSSWSTESSDLPVNRATDMTLDFGFVSAATEPPTNGGETPGSDIPSPSAPPANPGTVESEDAAPFALATTGLAGDIWMPLAALGIVLALLGSALGVDRRRGAGE